MNESDQPQMNLSNNYSPQPAFYCPPEIPQELFEVSGSGFSWIPTTSSTCESLESIALIGGYDQDQNPFYIGRAHHNGNLIPCKVCKNKAAYFSFAGEEFKVHSFELYCKVDPTIVWIPCSDGVIPQGAVEAGRTTDNEPLYVGRVYHEKTLTIGKVLCSRKSCYISFNKREIAFNTYEVMAASYTKLKNV